MRKSILIISVFNLFVLCLGSQSSYALIANKQTTYKYSNIVLPADTVLPADIMEVIKKAVYSLNKFDVDDIANLYTPNALIADDEPPYSWNGPTAGVQWVYAVEQACKDNKITRFKGSIEVIKVFQQNADNVYVVVPVTYTGNLPGQGNFTAKGAFTFVLRLTNGKWMIKSQVWTSKKAT